MCGGGSIEEMRGEIVSENNPFVKADLAIRDFENFVESVFLNFLISNRLEGGSLNNGYGEKAVVTKDKHGFFRVKYTKQKDQL